MSLQSLAEELSFPSASKLLKAAKQRGIPATKADVNTILKNDPTKQVFAKPPPAKGAHATNDAKGIWQVDLIDYSQFDPKNNDGFTYIMIATDLFTRKSFGEEMREKKPLEALDKFNSIVSKFGFKPTRVHVDTGGEFSEPFQNGLRAQNIVVTEKPAEDINGNAVVDAAIKSIKSNIGKSMAKNETTRWISFLDKAVKSYNDTPHETTFDEPPGKLSDVSKFFLYKENALKLKQNSNQLKNRQENLQNLGAFRPMMPRQEWTRAFKPKYSGKVLQVESINLSKVKASDGKFYDISRVLPVKSDSAQLNLPKTLVQGNEVKIKKQKDALRPFVDDLKNFLGNEEKSLNAANTFLKSLPNYENTLKDLNLNKPGSLTFFLRLFPGTFSLNIKAEGGSTVKVKRTRLVGKQRA